MKNGKLLAGPIEIETRLGTFMESVIDDEIMVLNIWKKRFASYFPNRVPDIKEYRFRSYDSKQPPTSLICLTYDGKILEFKTTRLGSAELKTLN